jgi:hypothetical protein
MKQRYGFRESVKVSAKIAEKLDNLTDIMQFAEKEMLEFILVRLNDLENQVLKEHQRQESLAKAV